MLATMLVETFPKANQSFLKATLVMWIPFVVSPQNPFVVSLSNHERTRAKIRTFFERPRAKPIPDCAALYPGATPLIMWIPFVVSPSNHERNQDTMRSSFDAP